MSGTIGITCQLCKENAHSIALHLSKAHDDCSLDEYKARFPAAPLLSPAAEAALRARQGKADVKVAAKADGGSAVQELYLHDVFAFGAAKAARNARGDGIKIKVFPREGFENEIPEKDTGYIFDIALTKTVLLALEMGLPVYLWGHAGVGKTTILEQVCAFTNRPFTRIQHTANTEEADIEGQWKVVDGEMRFELGPLPNAMMRGEVYCADEYDFANPQVLSVYQAVLEGKPLRIKSANMTIKPHPNFRFVATGNTNGSGDESGLYMGTQLQNSANYERFAIVQKVEYMPKLQEIGIIRAKCGVDAATAEKLVDFAWMMRGAFDRRDISNPMSPRSLQFAARLGLARNDIKWGIEAAFINRLPETSAAFARQTMQRQFG